VSVFALASGEMKAPLCHQEIAAVVSRVQRPSPSTVNCSYVHYTQTGDIQWVQQQIPLCADSGKVSNGQPRSFYSQKHLAFYWVSGTGQFLWQISVRDGTKAQIAQLPGRYNFTLGIAKLNTTVAVVTQDAVYSMLDGAALGPMSQTGFLSVYHITRAAVMTTDGDNIYIADGATLYTYINNEVSSFVLQSPITQVSVMQWVHTHHRLLMVSNSVVYIVPPTAESQTPEKILALNPAVDGTLLNTVDGFTGRPDWYYVSTEPNKTETKLFRVDLKMKAHVDRGFRVDVVGVEGNIQFFF